MEFDTGFRRANSDDAGGRGLAARRCRERVTDAASSRNRRRRRRSSRYGRYRILCRWKLQANVTNARFNVGTLYHIERRKEIGGGRRGAAAARRASIIVVLVARRVVCCFSGAVRARRRYYWWEVGIAIIAAVGSEGRGIPSSSGLVPAIVRTPPLGCWHGGQVGRQGWVAGVHEGKRF